MAKILFYLSHSTHDLNPELPYVDLAESFGKFRHRKKLGTIRVEIDDDLWKLAKITKGTIELSDVIQSAFQAGFKHGINFERQPKGGRSLGES